jgi:hypothetical protein
MVMAMPGTMTSGGQSVSAALQARARELESAEYSSSFFDEYDDDDMGSEGEGAEDDSGDDFDETTLWEIASLLKTDSIPSKMSLFPPPIVTGEVVDDYLGDIPSDEEGEQAKGGGKIVIGLSEDQSRDSVLWQASPKTPGRGEHGAGLPHPDEGTWMKYGAAAPAPDGPRVKTRVAEIPVIESDSLWTPKAEEGDATPAWTFSGKLTMIPRPAEVTNTSNGRRYFAQGELWKQPAAATESASAQGLFTVDAKRRDYRTTSAEPAAKDLTRKPRPTEHKPLDKLVSTSMWTKSYNPKARFQQLSHGTWSPPRVYHSTESGRLFAVDRSRSDYRSTTLEPAAKAMARKPRPAEHKPLDELTSKTLWSAPVSKTRVQHWFTATPKLSRPKASESDWQSALSSAMKLSYPLHAHPHRGASPADWAAALDHAVSLSYGTVSKMHDSAVVHPVFLGSLTVTCPADAVHPAMIEVVGREIERQEEESRVRDRLAEQIRLLEEEKMFVARMAGEIYSQRVLPVDVEEEEMVPVKEESRIEMVTGSGSSGEKEKEEGEAEILAQIKAIEERGELDTFDGKVPDEKQESTQKPGVVFRY